MGQKVAQGGTGFWPSGAHPATNPQSLGIEVYYIIGCGNKLDISKQPVYRDFFISRSQFQQFALLKIGETSYYAILARLDQHGLLWLFKQFSKCRLLFVSCLDKFCKFMRLLTCNKYDELSIVSREINSKLIIIVFFQIRIVVI